MRAPNPESRMSNAERSSNSEIRRRRSDQINIPPSRDRAACRCSLEIRSKPPRASCPEFSSAFDFRAWNLRLDFILIELLVVIAIVAATLLPTEAQTFTRITTGPVVTDAADGQGCAWVDFDNDGDLDLYVSCNRTGASLLYRNDGNGVFTKITTGPIVYAGVSSVGAS